MRTLACFAGLGLSAVVFGQRLYAKPSWYISFFGGHSFRVLSSQDIRTNYGLGIAWAKLEPRFKWRHGPTQLVVEGYYEHSNGETFARPQGRITDAVGMLWYARFRFPRKDFNLFADVGWGAQLSTHESWDLGTRLNSSPMLGFGISIRQGNQETLFGIRIIHLSNAGLNANNRGQNQVLLYTAVKF